MGLIRNIFIVGGLASIISACSQDEIQVKEVIRPVKLMDINVVNQSVLSFPGEVKASDEAKLAFRVPGQILKFHVKSGQMVKKGELLVELDPKDYEYKMQAALASFDLAKVELKRNDTLIKEFLISQSDYDVSKSNMEVAKANYNTSKANLSYTKVYMPYDGIIANTYQENFEYVDAQELILSIQSTNAIDVVIDVPERLVSLIRKQFRSSNITTRVSFPVNLGVEYEATYKDIGTIADKSTGSYEVTLTLPKPTDMNLYSGMTATGFVEVSYDLKNLAVKIPESAFIRENGQTMIWKYLPESSGLEKVSIPTTQEHELLTLLNHGDQVVIAGVNELTESTKVKPWIKERGL